VDTVGGLLARRLGVVPIPGTSIEVEGYLLTAESAVGRRHRISSVLAVPVGGFGVDAPLGANRAAYRDARGSV
jgi:CBS domain containing-hemolysin-like protein